MPNIREIYNALFAFAPAYMKMDWDNVGLLCGRFDREVTKVLVALDPMMDVFEEAKALGCELVVTHHPLIFGSLKQVNDESYDGQNLLFLIENGIASLNLHTNLDCCPGGVNDVLAETLGLRNVKILNPMGTDAQGRPYGLIRMGEVEAQDQRLPRSSKRPSPAPACGLRTRGRRFPTWPSAAAAAAARLKT